jgi:hypothetical protein
VEGEIRKLEAKRERIVDMRADGAISREECAKRLSAVDGELYNLRRAQAPERAPSGVDPRRIAAALVRIFARFGKLAFADQRQLLEEAVRTITIVDGGIARMTFSGGFLGKLAGVKVEAQLKPAPPQPRPGATSRKPPRSPVLAHVARTLRPSKLRRGRRPARPRKRPRARRRARQPSPRFAMVARPLRSWTC